MNIAKSAVLLAGFLMAGSIFAQKSNECGRHVRTPGEAIATHASQLESPLGSLVGWIDANVLDFHKATQASQILI